MCLLYRTYSNAVIFTFFHRINPNIVIDRLGMYCTDLDELRRQIGVMVIRVVIAITDKYNAYKRSYLDRRSIRGSDWFRTVLNQFNASATERIWMPNVVGSERTIEFKTRVTLWWWSITYREIMFGQFIRERARHKSRVQTTLATVSLSCFISAFAALLLLFRVMIIIIMLILYRVRPYSTRRRTETDRSA